eukprot:TRINITY_DN9561_c0_g1_i2.p3 TRINITY_DN9561_c0_g1~~TRINITY_DN9561_c0_g1_i2.p3  ORF type:complete len:118 (-),score=22.28 TRINITY_DN9561_c0_g1_i2:695-1048(-)
MISANYPKLEFKGLCEEIKCDQPGLKQGTECLQLNLDSAFKTERNAKLDTVGVKSRYEALRKRMGYNRQSSAATDVCPPNPTIPPASAFTSLMPLYRNVGGFYGENVFEGNGVGEFV